ncbi:MAG: DUF1015 domain-containing protein [Actinomycetota bacterium]
MPHISPFTGLVFDPSIVGPLDVVTAPPYDVIGESERRAFLASSPYSVVHLDLSEGDADRYERAADLLASWRSTGALVTDREPSYQAYEMRFRLGARARRIRGLLCTVELEDWGGGVLPHERTMPGPIEDRLRLLRATRTNLSPVYGTVAGPIPELAARLDEVMADPPPHATVDEQGVEHRMWPVQPDPAIPGWLEAEPLLIADGHHRYTTALRYRDERRASDGPGPWDTVLALVVDACTEDPPVLPFHRVVSAEPAPTAGVRVRDLQEVLAEINDDDLVYGIVARVDGGPVHLIADLRTGATRGPFPTVALLHERVLGMDTSGDRIRFTPDAVDAEAAVRSGAALAAYILPPTTPDRIRAVVEDGGRLPQKSTFFWPKPLTGMVLRPLE